jgi:hypothetical protein
LFTIFLPKGGTTLEICSNSSHQKGEITFYYQDQHLWGGLSVSLLSGASYSVRMSGQELFYVSGKTRTKMMLYQLPDHMIS